MEILLNSVQLSWNGTWLNLAKIAQTFQFLQLFCCAIWLVVPSIMTTLWLVCFIFLLFLEVEHSSGITNIEIKTLPHTHILLIWSIMAICFPPATMTYFFLNDKLLCWINFSFGGIKIKNVKKLIEEHKFFFISSECPWRR